MIVSVLRVMIVVACTSAAAAAAMFQPPREALCVEWRECRELALAAADRHEYEAFHDLAWRAIQTGRPNDPALMYLLARAQALSGRPHDALIMLKRLADLDVASDAATNEDFRRVRQLQGWPEVEARIERNNHPDPRPESKSPAASGAVGAAPAPAVRPSRTPPAAAAEAVRFSIAPFAVAGIAYDRVSRRFLVGDRHGRKLIVVAEGSDHALDLVRADSAGFHEISAIEIDAKRGDLWVASDEAGDGGGTLHRLQLVSGRPLKTLAIAPDRQPVRLVDLAITRAGVVLALDSIGGRLLVLRTGATALAPMVSIDAREAASVTAAGNERIAYVAHAGGVSRIDLRTRTATLIRAAKGISLAGLERIRWHRGALIAVRVDADGSRRVTRLSLDASGSTVTKAAKIETSAAGAPDTFVTISGDELVYLVADSGSGTVSSAPDAETGVTRFVAYRVRLR